MKKAIQVLAGLIILVSNPSFGQTTYDQYGGIENLHFNIPQTGFFQTHFHNGKWWFVTPENNAFLSYGINHFHANLWASSWNKSHWESEFGSTAWSEPWKDEFYLNAGEVLDDVSANSLGYHNEERFLWQRGALRPNIKHYTPVDFSLHMNPQFEDYVDVFDLAFVQTCDSIAQIDILPYVNDTSVIGFMMADIPGLTEQWAKAINVPTWALVLRNLPGTAAGKQEYVSTMQAQYSAIADFNLTYSTSFASWGDLLNAEDWRTTTDFNNAAEVVDNNVFNKKCMAKYYQEAEAALRRVDPNHLFFGDKLNANLTDINELDLMVDVAKDYVDVICVQFYGNNGYQTWVQNKIVAAAGNVPFINGDGGFGFHGEPNMPNPQTPTAANQAERAVWFSEYAERGFSNSHFIGWHVCGVIDAWNPVGTQKAGIMDPMGNYHQVVVDTMKSLATRIYEIRLDGDTIVNNGHTYPLLIDDFEDQDATHKLGGPWYSYNDQGSGGSSVKTFGMLPGGASASNYAANFTYTLDQGTMQISPFAAMGMNVSSGSGLSEDFSGSTAITFWHKGSSCELHVNLPENVQTPRNFDSYHVIVPQSQDWAQFTFYWGDFSQEGWGDPIAFDTSKVHGFKWTVSGNTGDYGEFWVDNVYLVDANGITGFDGIKNRSAYVGPNPFHNHIKIQADKKIKNVNIISINGKRLLSESTFDNIVQITTSSLPKGIYLLGVTFKDGTSEIKRIIKP